MAKSDGEGGKERQAGRTYKSSDVHRRTSSFKAIRGSKEPASTPASEATAAESAAGEVRPARRRSYATPESGVDDDRAARRRTSAEPVTDDAQSARGRTSATAERKPLVLPSVAEEEPDDASDGEPAPRAQYAGDVFASRRRRFDEENAPEVAPLSEDDIEDDVTFADDEVLNGAHVGRVRRVVNLDKPKRRVGRVIAIIITALLIIALVITAIFSWDRWIRYNDTADFQGQWYADGTATSVTIDEDTIRLTPDVAYLYELDTTSKTLSFSFGKLEGHGRYWFENDRVRLVIVDGEDYTAFSTFIDDFRRTITGFFVKTGGGTPELPEGQNVIVLSRVATEQPAQPAQPAEGQPPEGQPEEEQPAEGQTEGQTEGQPEQPAEGQPTEGQPAEAQPAEGQAAAPETAAPASASAEQPAQQAAQQEQPAQQGSSSNGRQMLSVSDILAETPPTGSSGNA